MLMLIKAALARWETLFSTISYSKHQNNSSNNKKSSLIKNNICVILSGLCLMSVFKNLLSPPHLQLPGMTILL